MHVAKNIHGYLRPKSSIQLVSFYLALFFVVAAVSQLYTFEEYDTIIASYGLPVAAAVHAPLAAVVVILEVLAIPFLLSMPLSRVMRRVSIISGWLVLIFWFAIGVWQSLASFYIPNAGLFGAKVNLPQGWWLVFYMAALLTLMGYVTYSATLQVRRRKSHLKKH